MPDMDVDCALITVSGVSPDVLKECVSIVYTTGRGRQNGQDLELNISGLYGRTPDLNHASSEVELEALELNWLLELFLVVSKSRTAQNGLYPATELPDGKWLGDVVVSP